MKKKHISELNAFSIVEVLVGIFIFSLGLVSVFMLLASSLHVNELNKNKIIASNLAWEQLELVRNIRDTNYATLRVWNQKNPLWDSTDVFEVGKYYILENDFSGKFWVSQTEIVNFWEGADVLSTSMQDYRLYRTPKGLYTYISSGNEPTHFYRFLHISPVVYDEGGIQEIENAYRVTSKVIWYKRGYHETQIDTIIADWRRI